MAFHNPTPAEVHALATKVASLVRALLLHPRTAYVGDKVTDPSNTPPTLNNVIDFVMRTYIEYLLPLLPPNATKHDRALANPWIDETFTESPQLMKDELYPRVTGANGLKEKWSDANSRSILIAITIQDAMHGRSPEKIAALGGPFDFGADVEAAANALSDPGRARGVSSGYAVFGF